MTFSNAFNEDFLSADSLISELLQYVNSSEPLITQFKAKFTCIFCGKKNDLENYIKPFKVIPILSPPVDSRSVTAGLLLTKFLNETFKTKCEECQWESG